MAEILECIAGTIWIVLGIYTGLKIRRVTKLLDDSIDNLNATFESDKNLPETI